ncbi:MAG: haloacid dehalogenase [Methylibium sp. NZG]|nr:MAG: haloacid dehalogenase [Methylibium sp. NZG]
MAALPLNIRALVFDVFGTVVDWRGSIIREGELLSATQASAAGLKVDWPAFADAWRAGYQPAMDTTRGEGAAWVDIDTLHRRILDGLLPRFGLQGLSADELEHLNRVWHRLMPWPDTVSGLNRLRARYPISTLSNGNVSLLVDMARNAGLPWDCVLSGELVQKYKPDPAVYLMAARLLGVAPQQLMLVAAHPSDLAGAQRAGLRTAYVMRPLEYGAGVPGEPVGKLVFDFTATDFLDLAAQLGA